MQTRRILHIIVSLLLLLTTSGVTVSAHYCHGRLMEIKITGQGDSCCDDNNCCTHESVTHRITSEFTVSDIKLNGPDEVSVIPGILFTGEIINLIAENPELKDNRDLIRLQLLLPFSDPDLPLIQSFLL